MQGGQGALFWLQSTAQTRTSGSTLISPAVSHHMESMNWDTPPTHTYTRHAHTNMCLQTQCHTDTVDRWMDVFFLYSPKLSYGLF